MNRMKTGLIALAVAMLGTAHAHDAWTEARGANYAVIYGHEGKLESYPPAKIKSVAAIDAKGAALAVKQSAAADVVTYTVSGKPALMTLHYDNGFWSKTTEGSKNLPKNEVPGALSASHVEKFGKTVYAWSAAVTKPQGQPLEIVPLSATAPAAGKTLPVQVLWQGKPLAGAKIARTDVSEDPVATTDADGKATLPVAAGHQRMAVSHKHALTNDARADSYSASANLVFEVR